LPYSFCIRWRARVWPRPLSLPKSWMQPLRLTALPHHILKGLLFFLPLPCRVVGPAQAALSPIGFSGNPTRLALLRLTSK
jgi:hypothetical protein